jgi:CPA2 family monovalent cation:H+ antiporter-2
MPHNIELLTTLAGGLGVALVLGLVTQRLKLSPLVGYLFAGVLVGPFTPGFVANAHLAEQLSEFGVVLLMFGVGLHFHVSDLLKVWRVALPGALAQIAAATGLGVAVTHAFGWSLGAGLVFGLAISVASTVVLIRVLADNDILHTPSGHVAVGWLVIEDIFTVLALVVLPAVAVSGGSGGDSSATWAILGAVGRIGLLGALLFGVGGKLIPVLLTYVARTRSRELFTLTVLVLALGIAVASATVFGVSMALGAFLAGMLVGRSELSARAASEALPMRDAFAVLFFVSVGMLLDPAALLQHAWLMLATIAVVLFGKAAVAFVVVRVLRHPVRTAVSVALALAQIGEFSFILGALGRQLGILPEAATQVLVVTAIVSITLNPLLFRGLEPLLRWLSRKNAQPVVPAPEQADEADHRAVVVGFGPVGQIVSRLLRDDGIPVTVVELNFDAVREIEGQGLRAVHGDAAQRGILEAAGVGRAQSLIFTAPGLPLESLIRDARELNAHIRILARASYVKDVPAMRAAGADWVVAEESEVGLAMTEHLLSVLGATPDQLDRARERAREQLFAVGSAS